ncbi:MAG: hypothetical protein H7039_21315 [Bryobacteraceae bacterium]|nr:hypothetical protein [Bryobacteraceae bacterium]
MNVQDAVRQSADGVARLILDDGLVSIARSPAGFHVSFIPRTAEGFWNLGATQSLGTAASVDGAELLACAERECVVTMWEPASENIIDDEPAVSVAPVIEGHHIRLQGKHPQSADNRSRLALLILGGAAILAFVVLLRRDRG